MSLHLVGSASKAASAPEPDTALARINTARLARSVPEPPRPAFGVVAVRSHERPSTIGRDRDGREPEVRNAGRRPEGRT